MWKSHIELLGAGQTQRVSILRDAAPLLYADVVDRWQRDETFRAFFMALLADAPFAAFFWETPPVTEATKGQSFEFVLVDSPLLAARQPDRSAFERYFDPATTNEGIVAFPNLGGDAYLVAPSPRAPLSAYPHLAAFSRQAPLPQQHALWRRVGAALEEHLHERPIWLSTAGLGISWLHVRLDSRPKYYSHGPYMEAM